jgi:hypothetical protein
VRDWTAEDLARAIERRRGREGRSAVPRLRESEDRIRDWSDADWAKAFECRHGFRASPKERVRVRETAANGVVRFDGDVHVFDLIGQAYPWQGYAWCAEVDGKTRCVSSVGAPNVNSARAAVRTWLGITSL